MTAQLQTASAVIIVLAAAVYLGARSWRAWKSARDAKRCKAHCGC